MQIVGQRIKFQKENKRKPKWQETQEKIQASLIMKRCQLERKDRILPTGEGKQIGSKESNCY